MKHISDILKTALSEAQRNHRIGRFRVSHKCLKEHLNLMKNLQDSGVFIMETEPIDVGYEFTAQCREFAPYDIALGKIPLYELYISKDGKVFQWRQ